MQGGYMGSQKPPPRYPRSRGGALEAGGARARARRDGDPLLMWGGWRPPINRARICGVRQVVPSVLCVI